MGVRECAALGASWPRFATMPSNREKGSDGEDGGAVSNARPPKGGAVPGAGWPAHPKSDAIDALFYPEGWCWQENLGGWLEWWGWLGWLSGCLVGWLHCTTCTRVS